MVYNSPVLYNSDLTRINSLDECISCVCTEEINTSLELVVEYPATGELASQISVGKFIVCKSNPYTSEQYFHIYRVSKTTQFMITVYAEHISYAYNHFICRPNTTYESEEAYASTLTSYLNSEAANNPTPSSGYSLVFSSQATGQTTWSITGHTEVKNVMSMAAKLYNAEWIFDNNGAILVDARGADRGVTLSISTNLVSLMADDDITDMYTHIYPFWKGVDEEGDTVTVYSSPAFVPIWSTTRSRFKAYVYDCSSFFSVKPEPSELYLKAVEFANINSMVMGSVVSGFEAEVVQRDKTIEGAQLTDSDHIEIGDYIHISVPEINLGATERVSATKYDALKDRLISVTIGKKRAGITDVFAKVTDKEKEEELEEEQQQPEEESDPFKDKIPDKVVKVSGNEVYALYDGEKTKVTWTAEGTGNERHNFKKTVESEEEEEDEDEGGNSGNDNDVE